MGSHLFEIFFHFIRASFQKDSKRTIKPIGAEFWLRVSSLKDPIRMMEEDKQESQKDDDEIPAPPLEDDDS